MTVEQLIQTLSQLPPDKDVKTIMWYDSYLTIYDIASAQDKDDGVYLRLE